MSKQASRLKSREVEPLIGLFVNTLVLDIRLEREARFLDLLAEVRHRALNAFAHQINVCTATACHSSGSEQIKTTLANEVKARGLGKTCLIRGVGCRGLCTAGPMVSVEPDGLLYQHVTPHDAATLLDSLDAAPVERLQAHTGAPFCSLTEAQPATL